MNYISLANNKSLSSTQCLGPANIEIEIVDEAISYLSKGINQIQTDLVEHHKIIKAENPAYLSKKRMNGENRFYIELVYSLSHLNSSVPIENLLLKLYKKVENLNVLGKLIDVRFEKGCHGATTDYWHRDFREKENINVLALSYSNMSNWSTKILNDKDGIIDCLTGGAAVHDGTVYQKCEEISENSQIGVIYNVNEVWHRSPLRTDFSEHVQEDKYRLFIKFNDRHDY